MRREQDGGQGLPLDGERPDVRKRTPGSLCRRFKAGTPVVLAIVGLLSACATPQERVATTEARLAAAGFVFRRADTPEREAMLQKLPPHRLLARRVGGGGIAYLYPDPLVCDCLYIGSAWTYGIYRQQALRQRPAGERQIIAEPYADPTWNLGIWDDPFGPGTGSGYSSGSF